MADISGWLDGNVSSFVVIGRQRDSFESDFDHDNFVFGDYWGAFPFFVIDWIMASHKSSRTGSSGWDSPANPSNILDLIDPWDEVDIVSSLFIFVGKVLKNWFFIWSRTLIMI
ncbi:hypothetical protein A2U01_0034416, partial [Trifolium medium]|nr:hypothetical protein [Trifolium medium]